MTLAEFIQFLQGAEMLPGDNLVIKTADGIVHPITGITRQGPVETTLPENIVDIAAQVVIQLG